MAVCFQVTTIGGTTHSFESDSSVTLADLRPRIAEAFRVGLDGLQLLHGDRLLVPSTDVVSLDGETLTITTQPWYAGKHFVYNYLRGRRCGLQEDEERWDLKVLRDGTFSCTHKEHSHDAEDGYSFDKENKASGEWTCDRDDLVLTSVNSVGFERRHQGRSMYNDCSDKESQDGDGTSNSDNDDDGNNNAPFTYGTKERRWTDEPWQHRFTKAVLQGPNWKVMDLN